MLETAKYSVERLAQLEGFASAWQLGSFDAHNRIVPTIIEGLRE